MIQSFRRQTASDFWGKSYLFEEGHTLKKINLVTLPRNNLLCPLYWGAYTANIFNVIFTLFTCVPFSNVIPLYGLHLITAPCTVEKCKHWFTVVYCNNYTCTLYYLRQIFVIFTVFTCVPFSTIHIYLQCVSRVRAKWSGPFFWVREFFEYHP